MRSRLFLLTSMLILSHVTYISVYAADPPVNCPDNMLLLLRLDESDCPFSDYLGLHNAVNAVCPTATPGMINGGQTFDATTKVDIPDIATEFDWESTASFTFEFWLNTTNNATMICLARHRLDTEKTAYWYVGTDAENNSLAAFELRDNGGIDNYTISIIKSTTPINDGAWHHIVAVRDGTNKYNRLYVDGVEEASAYVDYPYGFVAALPTEINVGYLHRSFDTEPEYHLVGSLDEIAIYDRALTSGEIASYYNHGSPAGHCTSIPAPVITSAPDTIATEDVPYTYIFTVDGPENVTLTLSAVSKPDWLNFNWTPGEKSAILTGTPGNDVSGTANVILRVSDGYTDVDQPFTISCTAVNDIPVITGQNVLYVKENSSLALSKSDLFITDVDNSDSEISIQVLDGTNYSFNGNTITPAANYSGQLSINVIAKDVVSQSAVYPVILTVNPVNAAPVFTSNPILTAQTNTTYNYEINVEDADESDVLTITAETKPDWLTFNAGSNNAFLMGIPTDSDVGSYAIIIKVSDSHEDVFQGFTIQVSGPLGIDDIDYSLVNLVYPNPAMHKIYFKLANTESFKLQIFDITGSLQKEVNIKNEDIFEISISDMVSGIYIYKIYQNKKVTVGKFAKN